MTMLLHAHGATEGASLFIEVLDSVVLDALIDTLKIIPFLFLTYLLMEWHKYKLFPFHIKMEHLDEQHKVLQQPTLCFLRIFQQILDILISYLVFCRYHLHKTAFSFPQRFQYGFPTGQIPSPTSPPLAFAPMYLL